MVTVFKFLSDEPVENVLSCMHYSIDKIVYFGYQEVIDKQKKHLESFLDKYCNQSEDGRGFRYLSHKDYPAIVKCIRSEIDKERSLGNSVYFDITGGDDLHLVAFGTIAKDYEAPLHLWDVEKDSIIELNEGSKLNISKDVEERKVKLDLDKYIELYGGIINEEKQKKIKKIMDPAFENDIPVIWEVVCKNIENWNSFSSILKKMTDDNDRLQVSLSAGKVISIVENHGKTVNELNTILDDFYSKGLILDLVHADGKYRFRFKSTEVKECLKDGGTILELYVYKQEKDKYDDCRVGVHIDWDGVIHEKSNDDVFNEIDVLGIIGNIPKFISCKTGSMESENSLHALYELEAVASRFGKYAKKELVVAQDMGKTYRNRAKEMNIEVRNCEKK